MPAHKSRLRISAFVALFVTILAFTATAAFAGPSDPTLTPTQLQSKIDAAGGSLQGYMKTVIKGSKIVTLSVDVLSVTTGFDSGPVDLSSLILFKSDDATITEIGGIAAGMSGSPIYVNDGGTDKLIGALSYGDIFTTHGYGLATPIGAMSAAQDAYAPSPMPRQLSQAVVVDGQVKDKVLVVGDPSGIASIPADTIVVAPKSSIFLGGIKPKSHIYQAYKKFLASKGVDVAEPLQGGLSSIVSTYNAPFTGGSAVAVLAARGDLWFGGIGTVTYVDTSGISPTVVAFGHPAFGDGNSGLFLSNAWIDGIWPSALEAYKLGRPATLRGTLTQDRSAAVIGVDGLMPDETTITAKATNLQTGKVATSAVELPRFVANSSNFNYFGLADMAVYVAGSRVFDGDIIPGSAVTTTTVTVKDGSQTFQIKRRNVYSDAEDIPSAVVNDVDEIVSELQTVNSNGIAHADILSVDLESSFSPARKEAEIVDLNVTGGLKHGSGAAGDNTVTVSFLKYGEPATQTVNVPLHIPSNVPITGDLIASAVNAPDGDLFDGSKGSSDPGSSIDRRTVKDVVSQLDAEVDNSVIDVSFQPVVFNSSPIASLAAATTYKAIDTTRSTAWVVSGTAEKSAPSFDAYLDEGAPSVLPYGNMTLIDGDLNGVDSDGPVVITAPGIATRTITTTDGSLQYISPSLRKSTTFTFTFLGNDQALPTHSTLRVYVAAYVQLSASKTSVRTGSPVTLTAHVLPKDTGGSVVFQRWNGWGWSTLKTVALPSTGVAAFKYTPRSKGKFKVRARFLGSTNNVAKSSGSVTITVK